MKWFKISLFLVVTGIAPVHAYHKMCYVHPHYGRQGCLQDLGAVMGEKIVYDPSRPVNYTVESPDGLRTCHVRLDRADKTRIKLYLDACNTQHQITDDTIQKLVESKRGSLKVIGWILRDFKGSNKEVTVEEIRAGLGIDQEREL